MKKRINKGYKLFILRTYVKAKNAPDAIRKGRKIQPDDVYVSEDWKEGKIREYADAIGFDDGMTIIEEEDEN